VKRARPDQQRRIRHLAHLHRRHRRSRRPRRRVPTCEVAREDGTALTDAVVDDPTAGRRPVPRQAPRRHAHRHPRLAHAHMDRHHDRRRHDRPHATGRSRRRVLPLVPEMRALSGLSSTSDFSASKLRDTCSEFEDIAEKYTGTAWVPRYNREKLAGCGGYSSSSRKSTSARSCRHRQPTLAAPSHRSRSRTGPSTATDDSSPTATPSPPQSSVNATSPSATRTASTARPKNSSAPPASGSKPNCSPTAPRSAARSSPKPHLTATPTGSAPPTGRPAARPASRTSTRSSTVSGAQPRSSG
jgi:hypothetical protein